MLRTPRLTMRPLVPDDADALFAVRFVFKTDGGAAKIDDISGGSGADAWDLRRIIAPGKK
jgi:hypothetical protein